MAFEVRGVSGSVDYEMLRLIAVLKKIKNPTLRRAVIAMIEELAQKTGETPN